MNKEKEIHYTGYCKALHWVYHELSNSDDWISDEMYKHIREEYNQARKNVPHIHKYLPLDVRNRVEKR